MLQKQSEESCVFFTHFPTKGDKLFSDRASTLAWKINGQRSLVGCGLWGR